MKALALSVAVVLQAGCCRRSFSYPVIFDVGRIEVAVGAKGAVAKIEDEGWVDSVVRFIDSRRSRWRSPRFGRLPGADANLVLRIQGRKGVVGLARRFLVAEFSYGKYQVELSGEEQQELFRLLGVDEKQVFGS